VHAGPALWGPKICPTLFLKVFLGEEGALLEYLHAGPLQPCYATAANRHRWQSHITPAPLQQLHFGYQWNFGSSSKLWRSCTTFSTTVPLVPQRSRHFLLQWSSSSPTTVVNSQICHGQSHKNQPSLTNVRFLSVDQTSGTICLLTSDWLTLTQLFDVR